MLKDNCSNCLHFRNKQISGTLGEIPYDQCWATPPDANGNRGKINDVTRTWCTFYTAKPKLSARKQQ